MARQKFEKSKDWIAWSGDLSSVRRLAALVAETENKRPVDNAKSARVAEKGELEPGSSRVAPVNLTIREGSSRFTARMDDALDQIDRRVTSGISIETDGRFDERIHISFNGHYSLNCELSVVSTDVDFARSAFARLADEIERGVPWWAKGSGRLQSVGILATVVLVLASCVGFIAARGSGAFSFAWTPFLGVLAGGSFFAIIFVMIPLTEGLLRWLFPVFEITGDGISSATRRLTAVILIFLSIPIGMLVNYIS